ncbi:MAG: M20 metallopeptidase family protein [Bacillota bacterium]
MISLRRDFHAHPEMGFEEERTSQIIYDYLSDLDMEVKRIAKTGVVGVLRGSKEGKTVMLRSDIDAVPVQEENELEFKSENPGVAHNCGHDGHMAMLLIAAKILSENKAEIPGIIKFAFQPNEEDAGAYLMIEDGVMEDPRVDAVFGLHLWSLIDSGDVGVVDGPIMASSNYFKIELKGKGGHAGAPHDSIDPIAGATTLIDNTYKMQSREINALKPTVISFCKIVADSTPTIIPEKVELEGSIRCLYDGFEEVKAKLERLTKNIAQANRLDYNLETRLGNSLLNNDPDLVEIIKETAADTVGREHIKSDVQVMLGEDFAEYSEFAPVAFYFLGIADPDKGTDYPHHHPKFNIDEDVLPLGVSMHIRSALNYLHKFN